MEYEYKTRGVCSRKITFSVEDGKVCKVAFDGGCNGNGKGVAALVEGMDVDEAISQMEMLGHTFFLFRDKTSDQICLVYTRQDGNYGVLIPE